MISLLALRPNVIKRCQNYGAPLRRSPKTGGGLAPGQSPENPAMEGERIIRGRSSKPADYQQTDFRYDNFKLARDRTPGCGCERNMIGGFKAGNLRPSRTAQHSVNRSKTLRETQPSAESRGRNRRGAKAPQVSRPERLTSEAPIACS